MAASRERWQYQDPGLGGARARGRGSSLGAFTPENSLNSWRTRAGDSELRGEGGQYWDFWLVSGGRAGAHRHKGLQLGGHRVSLERPVWGFRANVRAHATNAFFRIPSRHPTRFPGRKAPPTPSGAHYPAASPIFIINTITQDNRVGGGPGGYGGGRRVSSGSTRTQGITCRARRTMGAPPWDLRKTKKEETQSKHSENERFAQTTKSRNNNVILGTIFGRYPGYPVS